MQWANAYLDHRTEVVYGVGVACSMQVTHGLDAAQAAPSLLLAGPLIHLDLQAAMHHEQMKTGITLTAGVRQTRTLLARCLKTKQIEAV